MKLRTLLPCVILLFSGCDLLQTNNSENTPGRGARAFDPYTAQSGARRLALQEFHGCAITATGEPVARGTADIPYPATCPDLRQPGYPTVSPGGQLELVANSQYLLNQITLMDSVLNVYSSPDQINAAYNDLDTPARWMRFQSEFRGLDWSGLSLGTDRWAGTETDGVWLREISFTNAAWMNDTQDTFHIEVLDASGAVRSEQTYTDSDLLASNATSGHTDVSYRIEGLAPPKYPGDPNVENPPGSPPPAFRTSVKIERFGSTNPFKQFAIPDLSGDGAIRVTWSALPNHPFYFPVKFVAEQDIPASCVSPAGAPIACGPGLAPDATLSRPANGQFYAPGETFDFTTQIRDGDGNLLHDPDSFGSFQDFMAGQSNGLVYWTPWREADYLEQDAQPAFRIIGPVDKAGSHPDITTEEPYTMFPAQVGAEEDIGVLIPPFTATNGGPGADTARWSTHQQVTLPLNAQPGTYALLIKANRAFFGERVAKGKAVYFQVGQDAKTRWPGRVGNCQICHRGVLSLDNLRHGFGVDEVEGCKACHRTLFSNIAPDIHRIHMNSPKFPRAKNDCSTCHLTRESATKPSYDVCSSCHPAPHGGAFADVEFRQYGAANRYTECADACHVKTPPTAHILPSN